MLTLAGSSLWIPAEIPCLVILKYSTQSLNPSLSLKMTNNFYYNVHVFACCVIRFSQNCFQYFNFISKYILYCCIICIHYLQCLGKLLDVSNNPKTLNACCVPRENVRGLSEVVCCKAPKLRILMPSVPDPSAIGLRLPVR